MILVEYRTTLPHPVIRNTPSGTSDLMPDTMRNTIVE